MSYFGGFTATGALAGPATSNLLALIFVAMAATAPVHAGPPTSPYDNSTYLSKPVRLILVRDRVALAAHAAMPSDTTCPKEMTRPTCLLQTEARQLTDDIHVTSSADQAKSLSQWSSERMAVIVPQAMDPNLGNVELHFLTADGRNIKVIQKARRGAEEPDALSITVPLPFDDGDNAGLYCYISEEDYGFVQMYFSDDTNSKRVTLLSQARTLFRVFFAEVKRFTSENEITAENIEFGIVREVPTSLLKALDAILNASGGCSYETIFHLQVPTSGTVTGLNRAK